MYKPTRWWRVMRGNNLWCETSNEKEARSKMEPGDVLYRLYEQINTEWRPETSMKEQNEETA